MARQLGPDGVEAPTPHEGTVTGNKYVASPRARLCCDIDRKWRIEGRKYRRLFFLDEATALAAGHRPCHRCRRKLFTAFVAAWNSTDGSSGTDKMSDIDTRIDAELTQMNTADAPALPDGVHIDVDGTAFVLVGDRMRPWDPSGYGEAVPRATGHVKLLTTPTVVAIIRVGYSPALHASA